jgi:hypothetical protein
MGGTVFDAPVSMLARWEQKTMQDWDARGNQIISQAVVFTPEDVSVGGYMFLGVIASPDPTTVNGAFEIKNFVKTPTIRLNTYERRAIL